MEELKENLSMTYEEVLQDPSLSDFHEAVRLLQNRPHRVIFPKQYELSMLSHTEGKVIELFKENPKMPLKTVVSRIISNYPDDLWADLMSKLTSKIIEKWESLSTVLYEEKEAMSV
jgi:hypothetical protein